MVDWKSFNKKQKIATYIFSAVMISLCLYAVHAGIKHDSTAMVSSTDQKFPTGVSFMPKTQFQSLDAASGKR